MANNPEEDEFLEDEERDEIAQRSIFSAGWFRALLVLTVLAIIVVVSLPYLLNWLEPTPPAQTRMAKGADAPPPAAGGGLVPAPVQSAPPAKSEPAASAPPASSQGEAAKAAATAPNPADRPLGSAPLPATPAPAPAVGKTAQVKPEPEKAEPAKASTPKAEPAKPEAAKSEPAKTENAKGETKVASAKTPAPKRAAPPAASTGSYFVQLGAFAEEKNAEALAKTLRDEKFPVEVSRISRGGGAAPAKAAAGGTTALNQLFITGSTVDAVNAALKDRGKAQAVKGGIVVTPPYDLETAMSLSSALKKDGFKVVIRRARGGAPAKAAAPAAGEGGPVLHVVRVGGYPDRAKAAEARAELEAKGHKGFLAQGSAR